MQFLIGLGAGLIVAIVIAAAYVAGLHDRKVKPTITSQVDEVERKRNKQIQKDFNAMMNYNADLATQRVGE
jgi:outer membrane murein-binding lipoprotein Lpp